MAQESKGIKNPLTVVGIFAGLVEVCGSFVLPNLVAENQAVFVWFLMGFPTLLLLLFFVTLNFNHRVFYAPSDYQNEDNFVKAIYRAKPAEEHKKLEDEFKELATTEPAAPFGNLGNDLNEVHSSNVNRIFAKVLDQRKEKFLAAESLALRKLELEYGDSFQRGVTFSGLGRQGLTFDGLIQAENEVKVVEIKYVDSMSSLPTRIEKIVSRATQAKSAIPTRSAPSFSLILVLVVDGIQPAEARNTVAKLLEQSQIRVELRVFTYQELLG